AADREKERRPGDVIRHDVGGDESATADDRERPGDHDPAGGSVDAFEPCETPCETAPAPSRRLASPNRPAPTVAPSTLPTNASTGPATTIASRTAPVCQLSSFESISPSLPLEDRRERSHELRLVGRAVRAVDDVEDERAVGRRVDGRGRDAESGCL